MTTDEVIDRLAKLGDPKYVEGMAQFGLTAKKSFGVRTPNLKQFAREVRNAATDRHLLALELWKTEIYDARAVAFLIDDPKQVTEKQMESWASEFR